MEDIYYKLFWKMFEIGFPVEYKGYKMNYDYEDNSAEIIYKPIVEKIKIMWGLLK